MNEVVKAAPTEVTATNPAQMVESNKSMIKFFEEKISFLHKEQDEYQMNLDIAKKNKWRVSGLQRAVKLAGKRITYFRKLKSALEQGFHIIPNFAEPMVEIIAVRRENDRPHVRGYHRYGINEAKGQGCEQGVGEYFDPNAFTSETTVNDGDGKSHKEEYVTGLDPHIDFPVVMAKPEIMEVTSRAMALKLFDDIGFVPARGGRGDPMLIGYVKDPRSAGYNEKGVSFLIAWHLELTDL